MFRSDPRRGVPTSRLIALALGLAPLLVACGAADSDEIDEMVPGKHKEGGRAGLSTQNADGNGTVKEKEKKKDGELGFSGGDDWEPEIAADNAGHVYVTWTHFPGDTVEDPTSGGLKRIEIEISNDSGVTFGPKTVVSDTPGGLAYPDQGDSTVTVNEAGVVYVTFIAWGLNGNKTDVYVAKSTNFGVTFPASAVKKVNQASNCDHPWSIARGNNVYTMYAQGKSHYLSRSADGGATWTETKVLAQGNVAFPEGAVVDGAGNAWFAWADCRSSNCTGTPAVDYRVSRTLAGTSTTAFAAIATSPQGPDCPFGSCGFSFFGPQDDITIDSAGNLYLVWQDGQVHNTAKSPPLVNISRCVSTLDCTNASNWTLMGRVDDKNAAGCAGSGCYALFPRVEARTNGTLSAIWMDDRNGSPLDHENGWNVWMRSSTNGGASWTGPGQKISTYDPTRPESHPNGFGFPYGDYQGVTFIPGATVKAGVVWGEGTNFDGGPTQPGHIIYASAVP